MRASAPAFHVSVCAGVWPGFMAGVQPLLTARLLVQCEGRGGAEGEARVCTGTSAPLDSAEDGGSTPSCALHRSPGMHVPDRASSDELPVSAKCFACQQHVGSHRSLASAY